MKHYVRWSTSTAIAKRNYNYGLCKSHCHSLGSQDDQGNAAIRNVAAFIESKFIESKRVLKYLGVIIDVRLNFKEHVKYIGEKASVIQGALARMM